MTSHLIGPLSKLVLFYNKLWLPGIGSTKKTSIIPNSIMLSIEHLSGRNPIWRLNNLSPY